METVETKQSRQLTPAGRVAAAFTSPGLLFHDILRSTSWWPAFLLLAIVSVLSSWTVQKQVGWTRAYETILRQTPKQEERFAQMQPAQAAQSKAMAGKFVAVTAYGSPIIILLATGIVAAVLLGTLNFALGGKATYGQLFAVYMYASLPYAVQSLLGVVALFAGADAGAFLLSNPVGSNLGYYLSADTGKWLIALATSLDLFTLWVLVLLVIGCSIVARVSRASAATAVVGWWVLFVVIKVGAAALQG